MAIVSESLKQSFIGGPGGLRIATGVLTLVDGECAFNHGFNTVVAAFATPLAAENAVAVQTLTITGLTIPTNGWPKPSTDGQVTVKSNEAASTIQVFVAVIGM